MKPSNVIGQILAKVSIYRWLGLTAVMAVSFFAGTAHSQILAGEMLVEYKSFPGELESAEASPAIQVYADGRIIALFPVYMKRSGLWTGQLDSNEIAELVADIDKLGLADMDMKQLKHDMAAIKSASLANGATYMATDGDLTEFTIATSNGFETLQWRGLRSDAKQMKKGGLKAMMALEQRLLRLIQNLQPGGPQ